MSTTKTDPTPPSGMRTTAIALLFKDGFSVQDLVEIFSLSSQNIEEHVRRAMLNGHAKMPPVEAALPVMPRPSKRAEKPEAAELNSCSKHPGAKQNRRGECKKCAIAKQQKEWRERKVGRAAAPQSLGAAAVEELPAPPRRPDPPALLSIENESTLRIATTTERKALSTVTGAGAPDRIYSRSFTCPICHEDHRFWKRADAEDATGHWISASKRCHANLKIRNYQIKVDRGFRGDVRASEDK